MKSLHLVLAVCLFAIYSCSNSASTNYHQLFNGNKFDAKALPKEGIVESEEVMEARRLLMFEMTFHEDGTMFFSSVMRTDSGDEVLGADTTTWKIAHDTLFCYLTDEDPETMRIEKVKGEEITIRTEEGNPWILKKVVK